MITLRLTSKFRTRLHKLLTSNLGQSPFGGWHPFFVSHSLSRSGMRAFQQEPLAQMFSTALYLRIEFVRLGGPSTCSREGDSNA